MSPEVAQCKGSSPLSGTCPHQSTCLRYISYAKGEKAIITILHLCSHDYLQKLEVPKS